MESYNDKIIRWSAEDGGIEYVEINKLLQYLGDYLFYDYEPTTGSYPDYYSRLKKWMYNVNNDEDQKRLLKIAKRIFYVGSEEFNSLYKSAFNTNIIKWIVDQENIDITSVSATESVKNGLSKSWFCPVTDSLRINKFYHINQIKSSHEFRPDWRSLREFGDRNKIKSYIERNKTSYIILLEDFVGSATQSWKPLKFACEIDPSLNILFIPLIICQKGIDKINVELSQFSNFTIAPELVLSENTFIDKIACEGEDPMLPELRKLISNSEPNYKSKKYGFLEMGSLLVMHTNTPSNSLPIIYYESDGSWNSLFKRHHRTQI